MSQSHHGNDSIDRRSLVKVAAAGVVAGGLLAAAPLESRDVEAAFVPNNFHAVVHVTRQEDFPYAFSSLDTISQNYEKAKGRLVIDGDAVKGLSDAGLLDQIKTAKDNGAEIVAASDALTINGIEASTLPDYIDTGSTGVIAVVDAQVKGYHYYKL